MRHREQTDAAFRTGTEGAPVRALDFASQDCLGLSLHPEIVEAASETLRRFGVRSVCAETGDSGLSLALERRIADFLQMEEAMLCATGRAAGQAVIRGLVRASDHVVIDAAIRGGLREGAEAATRNLFPFRHLDASHCRARLRAIRAREAASALSPIQNAVILKAFAIIDAAEGQERRARLMRNVLNLRAALREQALEVCGEPCATVSVRIESGEHARSTGRLLAELGLLADLSASSEDGRLRLHVTADHSDLEIERAATCVAEALARSRGALTASPRRTALRAAA